MILKKIVDENRNRVIWFNLCFLISSFHRWFLRYFLHAVQKGADIEWFGDEISDIRVDIVELLSLDSLRGEHDDGIIVGEPIDGHFLDGLDPIHDRHHQVQDDDPLETFLQFDQTIPAVVRCDDLKAFPFEKLLKAQNDIRVVIHDHEIFLIISYLIHTIISS